MAGFVPLRSTRATGTSRSALIVVGETTPPRDLHGCMKISHEMTS
jgi:hypothetical protein